MIDQADSASSPSPPRRSRFWATVRRILRARITAGLAVVLPIWVTFLLVKFIFGFMRDMSLWVVVAYLETDRGKKILESWGRVSPEVIEQKGLEALPPWLEWTIAIACVLLTIFFLYIIGLLTANLIGRRIVAALEGLVDRLPLVKSVYRASKQILQAFTGESTRGFKRVALVPFPCIEVRSVGFITSTIKDADSGEDLCSVFLPTTPNPTTGYVLVLRRSDIIEVDWSIEDAVGIIMSGGSLMPSRLPLVRAIPAYAMASGPASVTSTTTPRRPTGGGPP